MHVSGSTLGLGLGVGDSDGVGLVLGDGVGVGVGVGVGSTLGLVLGVANYFMNKAEKKKTEEKGVIRA